MPILTLGVSAIRLAIVMLCEPSSAVRSRLTAAVVELRLPSGRLVAFVRTPTHSVVPLEREAEAFPAPEDLLAAAARRYRHRQPSLDQCSSARVEHQAARAVAGDCPDGDPLAGFLPDPGVHPVTAELTCPLSTPAYLPSPRLCDSDTLVTMRPLE